jgi:hypothetical protein
MFHSSIVLDVGWFSSVVVAFSIFVLASVSFIFNYASTSIFMYSYDFEFEYGFWILLDPILTSTNCLWCPISISTSLCDTRHSAIKSQEVKWFVASFRWYPEILTTYFHLILLIIVPSSPFPLYYGMMKKNWKSDF